MAIVNRKKKKLRLFLESFTLQEKMVRMTSQLNIERVLDIMKSKQMKRQSWTCVVELSDSNHRSGSFSLQFCIYEIENHELQKKQPGIYCSK